MMVNSNQNQTVPAVLPTAEAASELERLKDLRERLFESAFDGIIIANIEGDLLDCNQATEDIFEMKAGEMRGVNIRDLYCDPEEPAKIGELLSKAEDGKLRDYQTCVKNRYGNHIPIILSACWMYDQDRHKIGSVGYFRDLRSAHKDERYLKLLQDSSQIVAESSGLEKGLENLVKKIVEAFLVSFSSILLLDANEQTLVVKSVCAIERKTPIAWNPTIGKCYDLTGSRELERVMEKGTPAVFQRGKGTGKKFLHCMEKELGLQEKLQSALVVPFKTQSNKVGVSIIGEMRSWQRRPFTERDLEVARTMAVQLAALIEKIKLHDQVRLQLDESDRRSQLLSALDDSLRHIRAERERSRLLHEIVRMSAELLDCPVGYLLLNHRVLEELEVVAVYGLKDELISTRMPNRPGFAGQVVSLGKRQVAYEFKSTDPADQILRSARLKSVLAAPIKEMGAVEAVLLVGERKKARRFSDFDLEILERLLTQASIALQTSRLIGKEQRVYAQLTILKKISDYIQSAQDLETIFHVVLTGITAGYGLRFNRAALLLLSEDKSSLIGHMGIGEIKREVALEDWKEHHKRGMDNFDTYLKALEANKLPLTPIGKNIFGLKIALDGEKEHIFMSALAEKKPIQIGPDMLAAMPESFRQAFEPDQPLVVAPLMTRDQILGAIVVDNKFTHAPITEEDLETLMAFTNTAAIAIDNSQRFETMQADTADRKLLQKISTEISAKTEVNEILSALIEGGKALLGVEMAVVHMLDERTGTFQSQCAPKEMEYLFTSPRRETGLTWEIIRTGNPVVIPDTEINQGVNPEVKKAGVRSLVGFPLQVQNKTIGVLFFNSTMPQRFGERELELISLLVSQAAVAIENGRAYQELELNTRLMISLVNVSQKLTETLDLNEQMEIVRDFAVEDFNAPMFFIGLYDQECDTIDFKIIEENKQRIKMAKKGITNTEAGGVAGYVIKSKQPIQWYSCEEKKEKMEALGFQTIKEGTPCESCFVAPLESGGEIIGVVSIQNDQPHAWGKNELNAFQTLARLVSVAIQNSELYKNLSSIANENARLLQQVSQAKKATDVVAEVMVLGKDIRFTLNAVVEGIKSATQCDAVVLYVYDETTGILDYPPTMVGVKDPEKALKFGKVREDSIVYTMLWQDRPYYIAEVIREDIHFNNRRFSLEEGIESCVALPLLIGGKRVGVVFVNYHTRHHFTRDELSIIRVLANQAAVAINNAQTYYELQQQVSSLTSLYAVGQSVTEIFNIEEILNRIAEQAYSMTGLYGEYASHVSIVRVIGSEARYEAAYPPDGLETIRATIGTCIDLEKGINGRIGIIGRTIKTGKPQLVENVEDDPDYLASHKPTRSEVAVPIRFSGKIVGVINAEHPQERAFDMDDVRALETLAFYTALALQHAEQFEYITELGGFIGNTTAVEWIKMVSETWGHSIRREVGTAFAIIDILKALIPDRNENIDQSITELSEVIQMIKEIPLKPPLSSEDVIDRIGINELVHAYLDRQWKHAQYDKIKLCRDTQPGLDNLATVRTSPEWLRRALEILVENAVQAMLEADSKIKQLNVETKLVGERIQIHIKDTGPGIPEKYRENLFTKTKDDTKGAGVGLVLAYRIIQTYWGELWLESTSGNGTEMVISLPVESNG